MESCTILVDVAIKSYIMLCTSHLTGSTFDGLMDCRLERFSYWNNYHFWWHQNFIFLIILHISFMHYSSCLLNTSLVTLLCVKKNSFCLVCQHMQVPRITDTFWNFHSGAKSAKIQQAVLLCIYSVISLKQTNIYLRSSGLWCSSKVE